MTDERYHSLMWKNEGELTADEIAEGWHWCWDWDGLLVGPGMEGELESCHCNEPAPDELVSNECPEVPTR